MNFGDPIDQAIEQLIRAAIYTSHLYFFDNVCRFRIFVNCVYVESHWHWISGSIGRTDRDKKQTENEWSK